MLVVFKAPIVLNLPPEEVIPFAPKLLPFETIIVAIGPEDDEDFVMFDLVVFTIFIGCPTLLILIGVDDIFVLIFDATEDGVVGFCGFLLVDEVSFEFFVVIFVVVVVAFAFVVFAFVGFRILVVVCCFGGVVVFVNGAQQIQSRPLQPCGIIMWLCLHFGLFVQNPFLLKHLLLITQAEKSI